MALYLSRGWKNEKFVEKSDTVGSGRRRSQIHASFRRDQRAVCSASRALVTSGHPHNTAIVAGFRLRPGGGSFRSGCIALDAPFRLRSSFPARRPQTEARFIAETGVMTGVIPPVVPAIPVCGQLPPPVRTPWARRCGIHE
jgi:hypothetical protein